MPRDIAEFKSTLHRLGGDHDLFRDLVRFYFEDYPGLMEQLRFGALNRDADAIERAAHKLRGLICNFDVSFHATDSAMLIEQMGHSRDFQGVLQALPILENSLSQLHELLIPFQDAEQ
jgi:HPt (histidine-containing phosphotransfer) domain-containing protein